MPHTAAKVLGSLVVLVFLLVFVCQTQSVSPGMNCWTFGRTHHKIFYGFRLFWCFAGHSSRRSSSALMKLRQRWFQMPLPSIHLANLHSLPNKTDKLLISRLNKDFSNSAALCFRETWPNCTIPDSQLHLLCIQLFGADRNAELTGKLCGGRTCFYINERWCTDVTVLKKMCCPDIEALFINCKPFYSPREFCSFILVIVYISNMAWFTANMVHCKTQTALSGQRCLREVGTDYCIKRPNKHWKKRSVAKRNYSDKLRIQFSSSDPASVWKCLKDITI